MTGLTAIQNGSEVLYDWGGRGRRRGQGEPPSGERAPTRRARNKKATCTRQAALRLIRGGDFVTQSGFALRLLMRYRASSSTLLHMRWISTMVSATASGSSPS